MKTDYIKDKVKNYLMNKKKSNQQKNQINKKKEEIIISQEYIKEPNPSDYVNKTPLVQSK